MILTDAELTTYIEKYNQTRSIVYRDRILTHVIGLARALINVWRHKYSIYKGTMNEPDELINDVVVAILTIFDEDKVYLLEKAKKKTAYLNAVIKYTMLKRLNCYWEEKRIMTLLDDIVVACVDEVENITEKEHIVWVIKQLKKYNPACYFSIPKPNQFFTQDRKYYSAKFIINDVVRELKKSQKLTVSSNDYEEIARKHKVDNLIVRFLVHFYRKDIKDYLRQCYFK